MTIRSQLLATYLVVSTLGIVGLGIYDLWSFQSYFRESSAADLEGRSVALAGVVAGALAAGDRPAVRLLVQEAGTQEGINVRVIAADGRLLASSQEDVDRQLEDWSDVPGVAAALQGTPVVGVAPGVFARGERLYHARALRVRGRLLGVLRISVTLDHFRQQLALRWQTLLAAVLGSFALCALASFALARGIARPIQAMRDFAVRTGTGRFDASLKVSRADELGELAQELNTMAARLGSLEQERRAFLAGVAHELRTPVTNVTVTLEALQSGATEEPELCGLLVQSCVDEIARLEKLVEDLLELGRLEAGAVSLQFQRVNLRDVAARAALAIACRGEAQDVTIRSEVPDLEVYLDPDRLSQVLLILLDNALKHAPSGTTIALAGRGEGTDAVLTVADQGPGIAPEHVPHVFEQFFMADPARRGAGAGLGLAIARRIVGACGGTITVQSAVGKGTTMVVRLPAAAADRGTG